MALETGDAVGADSHGAKFLTSHGVPNAPIVPSGALPDKQDVINRIRAALPELVTVNRWLCWRMILNPDPTKKPKKVPVNPRDGTYAKSTDSATWGSFIEAALWYQRHDEAGLGFALGDGWAGVDLDDCADAEGGISPEAWRIIESFNSYAEFSPSGRGVHILLRGADRSFQNRDMTGMSQLEVYSWGRYFTVTGQSLAPGAVTEAQNALDALWAAYAPKYKRSKPNGVYAPGTWGNTDLALVDSALRSIPPWSIDYGQWVAVLMAIHAEFGDMGLPVAESWGQGAHGEVKAKWRSFHTEGNGAGQVGLGTLFDLAKRFGWQRPRAEHPVSLETLPVTAGNSQVTAPGESANFLLTEGADDDGNSRCVAALHPGRFLHCEALGWLGWDGVKWASGAEPVLDDAIKTTLKTRRIAAVAAEREAVVKAATPSARRVRDARFMLSSLLTAPVESFDAPAHLLNAQNGVINLATGELLPHDPHAHRFTYVVNAAYDPQADRSEWLAFLRQTIGADDDLLRFVQMAVGYSLTGETREECLFYVHGPARSGKGTFGETLLALLGAPLALAADFGTFSEQKNDVQNFALAALRPARLVVASESERYTALNPARIKSLTGGDSITAALKFKDAFTFRPRFKMWLFSNWPVNVDVDDDAAWYRLRVIPFPNSHAGQEDKTLKARLRSGPNLAGVLAWGVEGARMWYRLGSRGLETPKAIEDATRIQRTGLDFVQAWLDEACVTGPNFWLSNELLYQSYGDWCRANGVSPKGQKGLAQSLQAKGFTTGAQKKVGGVNHRGVEGLDLAIRQAA